MVRKNFVKSRGNYRKDSVIMNDGIRAYRLLVIDENGEKLGEMSRDEALRLASGKGLDLIQVHYDENKRVAIAKIMDYGKYKYLQHKKSKQKAKKKKMKEVKFGYSIGENDLQLKIKKIKEILDEGNDVKVLLRLRGREKMFREMALEKFKKVVEEVKDYGKLQTPEPKQESQGYSIILFAK